MTVTCKKCDRAYSLDDEKKSWNHVSSYSLEISKHTCGHCHSSTENFYLEQEKEKDEDFSKYADKCYNDAIPMIGVRTYSNEDYLVRLEVNPYNYRFLIRAINEGGHNSTTVDLIDVIRWVKNNKPELLKNNEG